MRRSALALVLSALVLTACQPAVRVSPEATQLLEVRLPPLRLVPEVPSTAEGRRTFELRCAFCHGTEGRGDGPAAEGLKAPHKNPFTDTMRLLGFRVRVEDLPSRPADFHNVIQMRLNSPFSMYETVKLGRPHTAMPAFGKKPAYGAEHGIRAPGLPDQVIWNVVFYEWTFATTPETLARGRDLYENRVIPVEVAGLGRIRATCAACHGARGDGRGGAFSQAMAQAAGGWGRGRGAGIFTDRDFMVKRKPAELFVRITDGHGLMPAYQGLLTEEEIWAIVDYLWTFMYQYSRPAGPE